MGDCSVSSIGAFVEVTFTAPTTFDAAGYATIVDYVELGGNLSLPTFGGTSSSSSNTPLKTGVVCKSKGAIDWGQLTLDSLHVESDAAQLLMFTGLNGANKFKNLTVKLTYGNGAVRYTGGIVSSYTETVGSAGDDIMMGAVIDLNYDVIMVVAPIV